MQDILGKYLSQKIGVFFGCKNWMKEVYDLILNKYPPDFVNRTFLGKQEAFIELKDGSIFEFIDAYAFNSRGKRYDKIIIENSIYDVIIDCEIIPALKCASVLYW